MFLFNRKANIKHQKLRNYLNSKYDIKTRNIDIYALAFIHKSVANKNKDGFKLSNERLEFLGDAIIGAVITEYLYNKYPNQKEGFLTQLKSKIVSRETLNKIGKEINLIEYIQHNIREKNIGNSLVGNVLEAFIGAIYLDKGYDKTKKIILQIIKKNIDLDTLKKTTLNYKSKLLIECQKQQKKLSFKEINKSKIEGEYFFTIALLINDEIKEKATAKSKRKAEQKASKEYLERKNKK